LLACKQLCLMAARTDVCLAEISCAFEFDEHTGDGALPLVLHKMYAVAALVLLPGVL